MNVFNKVTLQALKKNRTRTAVTIIGVILSIAMITAVTSFISSLQNYIIQEYIYRSGDWHAKFKNVDAAFAEKVTADEKVRVASVIQNIGYAMYDNGQYEKPYFYVAGLDDTAFGSMGIHLTNGRLPQNSNEILIPEYILADDGMTYKPGDTLTLSIGSRISYEGAELDQSTPFLWEEESFLPKSENAYTVVGICERAGFEDYSSPGHTLVTKTDAEQRGGLDVYVSLKTPAKIYDYVEETAGGFGVDYNREFLRYYGVSANDSFNTVLYSLGAILISLILIGSVLLIYNSFAISVSERTRQFGILSSVGAAKKQIRRSVLFEGVCIGVIGIPLGIIAGAGGMGITLRLIGDITKSMFWGNTDLSLHLSCPAVVAAAVIGSVTILISAYIPAKRAAKKTPIDIIRQADDIKIKPKEVKTSKFAGLLFGVEGTLALKNFKRNKKRYRSTVISLFVSIVLFVAASAFCMYLTQATKMTIQDTGYDISFSASQNTLVSKSRYLSLYDRMKTAQGVTQSAYSNYIYCSAPVQKSDITERYFDYFYGGDMTGLFLGISIHFIDDITYRQYIESLGFSPDDFGLAQGKFLAAAKAEGYDPEASRTISIDIFNNNEITLDITEGLYSQKISLIVTDAMPYGVFQSPVNGVAVFAPYSDIAKLNIPKETYNNFSMYFSSNDPAKSFAEMEVMVKDAGIADYYLYDVTEPLAHNRNIIFVVNIFTYGFVILISLITIANVFNTISTSINLRKRELAMLRSVGLGSRGFNKMINFECIFYGLKALLYGLPVSAALTYFIYKAVLSGADVSFVLPWSSIAISVFGVFFVVFVTMLYSTNKIKKANITDALRIEV
ncbi:MAG: FtsX-like permease family protein [Christensenellales bacterium]